MSPVYGLIYILLAPIAGGLVAGIDRKITARMQGR
ncbi:MAG TPA: NADH-quinone oxidoreductase subunit H, partial [Methanoregulaceae archaeon]|nr:NADH-quinone oxidoreductase subunit H [Methanoregulaceae archaeon]